MFETWACNRVVRNFQTCSSGCKGLLGPKRLRGSYKFRKSSEPSVAQPVESAKFRSAGAQRGPEHRGLGGAPPGLRGLIVKDLGFRV